MEKFRGEQKNVTRFCDFLFFYLSVRRPPDKSVYLKSVFFISCPKHVLWVLKRMFSMRWFFSAPKTHAKIDGKENIYNFTLIKFPYLDL